MGQRCSEVAQLSFNNMKVPAENMSARPMLSSVAKEVSFNTKYVKIAIIGDANAKAKRYNFDFTLNMNKNSVKFY